MTSIAATFPNHIRRPQATYRTNPRLSHRKRFQHFIEQSDWDERIIAHEERANKICIGIMIASVLYFVPVLVRLFMS